MYYHRLGTNQSEDTLIFKNDDEAEWMFGADVTHDGKYVLISTSKDTDDVSLLQIADISAGPNKELNQLLEVKDLLTEWIGGLDYIHNMGTKFYFKTNIDSPRSKIIMMDIENPAQDNWIDALPQHSKNALQYGFCVNGLVIAGYLQNAQERVRVYRINQENHKVDYWREI